MLLLFSHSVSLYMCNNSKNGANLSGSFIFTLLRFLHSPYYTTISPEYSQKFYKQKDGHKAVTRDDDMIFAVKFRHNLPDYGGCQFQFRLFFLPHTITKRNGKMRYFIPIPDRYAEHDSHKAVSIQIVGTVVCSMVKQF